MHVGVKGDRVSQESFHSAFGEDVYRDQADFRCALRKFLRYSEQHAHEQGITPQQHLLLLITRGHDTYPGVTIGDLAEALQLRQSGVSLLVDRCVKRGLLRRDEDPDDRRRAAISLTPEGQRILDAITLANRQVLGSLEGSLFRDSFHQKLRQLQEPASAQTAS